MSRPAECPVSFPPAACAAEIDGPLQLIWASSELSTCGKTFKARPLGSAPRPPRPAPPPNAGGGPARPALEPGSAQRAASLRAPCVLTGVPWAWPRPHCGVVTGAGPRASLLGLLLSLGFGIWNPLLRRLGSHSGMGPRGRPGQEAGHPAHLLWASQGLRLPEPQLPSL